MRRPVAGYGVAALVIVYLSVPVPLSFVYKRV
eukprot:COSAG03_NODE_16447_length_401_cov_2.298013_2_plen_31_part_01